MKAWRNIWELKYLHLNHHPLTKDDFDTYRGCLEGFLLNLKDNIDHGNAEITFEVVEIKRALFGLRVKDLIYFIEIQGKVYSKLYYRHRHQSDQYSSWMEKG